MARAKKQVKAKEPVRLRMKQLSNGNKSLYLDIYHNGKRTYEYLKLYLVPDAGDGIAQHQNSITMMAANARKSRRIIEITSKESGIYVPELKEKIFLVDWMQTYLENQQKRGKRDIAQIKVALRIVKEYAGENTLLDEVDKAFCLGLLDYLQTEYRSAKGRRVSNGTLHNYYRCVNSALNAAVRAEHIKVNPFNLIDPSDKIRKPESKREYLTIDEVRSLIATPVKSRSPFGETIKKAYLFSCFCGLRISDVRTLTWGNVICDRGQYRLEVVMQKTKDPIYLPLSNEALRWMPERGEKTADDKVFDLPCFSQVNDRLKVWAKAAGINKNMTFHTARHTFATMMLTLGADLYTTSKLLGHSDVQITQVYAKIVNQKKDEAVNLVNGLFG